MSKQINIFDDITSKYHKNNVQSVAAFNSVKANTCHQRELVFDAIAARSSGYTCDELEMLLGLSHQACSARCTELKAQCRIEPSGLVRRTRAGRLAAVLVVMEMHAD
jgi:hypothetical protein